MKSFGSWTGEHSFSCKLAVLLVILWISILAVFSESLCKIYLQAERSLGLRVLHEKSEMVMKNENTACVLGTMLYVLGTALKGRQAKDS